MIVSHKHRFIYFAVPRTATHSVRLALQPHLGPDDWQQEHLVTRSVLPIAELAQAGHGHIGVRALRPHLADDTWLQYFKFAVVRHPYDRFVSVCAFLNRDNAEFGRDPAGWMSAALHRPRFQQRLLVRPQVDMLVDETGSVAVDFLGRYEHLPASVHTVATKLGFDRLALTHENQAPRPSVNQALSHSLKRALDEYYRRDFELLGYQSF